jgi:hypothetical protein
MRAKTPEIWLVTIHPSPSPPCEVDTVGWRGEPLLTGPYSILAAENLINASCRHELGFGCTHGSRGQCAFPLLRFFA